MKYRESILKTLDLLISESSKNTDEKTKDNKLEAWHIGLEDISDEQVGIGLRKALKSTTGFLMSCGEFRELCILSGEHNSIDAEANEAWMMLMSNLSAYSTLMFKNASIAEAVRQTGGWRKLCSMLTKEEPFLKKDFVASYKSIRKSNNHDLNPVLRGQYGLENGIKSLGYSPEDQNLIEQQTEQAHKIDKNEAKMIEMMRTRPRVLIP